MGVVYRFQGQLVLLCPATHFQRHEVCNGPVSTAVPSSLLCVFIIYFNQLCGIPRMATVAATHQWLWLRRDPQHLVAMACGVGPSARRCDRSAAVRFPDHVAQAMSRHRNVTAPARDGEDVALDDGVASSCDDMVIVRDRATLPAWLQTRMTMRSPNEWRVAFVDDRCWSRHSTGESALARQRNAPAAPVEGAMMWRSPSGASLSMHEVHRQVAAVTARSVARGPRRPPASLSTPCPCAVVHQ